MTESSPELRDPACHRFRFSLRALLAAVTLAAVFCSVGVCTGWLVATGVATVVLLGAAVGGAVGKSRRRALQGMLVGMLVGLLAALVGLLVITVTLAQEGLSHVNDEQRPPRDISAPRSAAELLRQVQTLIPSAQGLSERAPLKDIVAGHYERNFESGDDLYLFPDQTYLYLEWMDILPYKIYDRGTWDYREGFVILKTDGAIAGGREPRDAVYLPLVATIPEPFRYYGGEKKECKLLLGVHWELPSLFENYSPTGSLSVEQFLALDGCFQTGAISASDVATIQEDLYARCAPDFDWMQWRRRIIQHAMASALLLAIAAVGWLGSRKAKTLPDSGA